MSRPRVRRTVAGMRARSSTALKPRSRRGKSLRTASVKIGLYGMRFTLNDLRVEQRRERARVRRRVVHAGEHDVLDEDLPPAQLEVAAALGDDVGERVAVVHGHQLRALRGIGRVEREREPDRESTSSTKRRNPGIQPTVEIVVRRGVIPRSGSRGRIRAPRPSSGTARPSPCRRRGSRAEPAEVERLVEDLRTP